MRALSPYPPPGNWHSLPACPFISIWLTHLPWQAVHLLAIVCICREFHAPLCLYPWTLTCCTSFWLIWFTPVPAHFNIIIHICSLHPSTRWPFNYIIINPSQSIFYPFRMTGIRTGTAIDPSPYHPSFLLRSSLHRTWIAKLMHNISIRQSRPRPHYKFIRPESQTPVSPDYQTVL